MLSKEDQLFIQKALELRLIDQSRIKNCSLVYQNSKTSITIGDVIIRLGFMNAEQVKGIYTQVRTQQTHHDSTLGFPKSNSITVSDMAGSLDITRSDNTSSQQSILKEGGKFGRYRVEKKLGQGGMGEVYQIFDEPLQRSVAIKVISKKDIDEKAIKRFLKEAQSTAALKHPNIVEVYEIGETPFYYFTMEHIKGSSLSSLIHKQKITAKRAAKIVSKCSLAIDYAHQNGIIHRDIKPSNIMMENDKEPKVMDFGLAKSTQGDHQELSKSGDMIGTPVYMSPEQANGLKLDSRSDIYSLGATLYELLCKRPPFQGESLFYLLKQIFAEDPIEPKILNPDIPKDLESICLKCLDKKPAKRYQSAKELATDLDNYLNNMPVIARPITPFVRLKKWVSRNRAVAIISSLALLIMFLYIFQINRSSQQLAIEKNQAVAAKILAEKKEQEANEQREEAQRQKAEADKQRKEAQRQKAEVDKQKAEVEKSEAIAQRTVYQSSILLANFHNQKNDIAKAYKILNDSKLCAPIYQSWEWHWQKTQKNYAYRSFKDKGSIFWVTASKNGKMIAFTRHIPPLQYIVVVTKINPQANKILDKKNVLFTTTGQRSAFHPNNYIIAIANDSKIELFNIRSRKKLREFHYSIPIKHCIFSKSGSKLLIACAPPDGNPKINSQILILEDLKRRKRYSFSVDILPVDNDLNCCDISPDEKWVVASYQSGRLYLWNIKTQKRIDLQFANERTEVYYCRFSPDGKILASASADKKVILWNLKHKKSRHSKANYGDKEFIFRSQMLSCEFNAQGSQIIAGSADNNIYLINLKTNNKPFAYTGHLNVADSSCFIPGTNMFVSGSRSSYLKFWKQSGFEKIIKVKFPNSAVEHCQFYPQGDKIAVAPRYPLHLVILDAHTGKDITPKGGFIGHWGATKYCSFNSEGLLATVSHFKRVFVWDAATGKQLKKLEGHDTKLEFCAFHPTENNILFSVDESGTIIKWDINTGKIIYKYFDKQVSIDSCDMSLNGNSIVISSAGFILLWDLNTRTKKTYPGTRSDFIGFSLDGKILLGKKAADRGREIDIKSGILKGDIANGEFKISNQFIGHTDYPYCFAFHPDKNRMVTGGRDSMVCLWDISNTQPKEKPLLILEGHTNLVNSCDFSPDGKMLVTADQDGNVFIWKADK